MPLLFFPTKFGKVLKESPETKVEQKTSITSLVNALILYSSLKLEANIFCKVAFLSPFLPGVCMFFGKGPWIFFFIYILWRRKILEPGEAIEQVRGVVNRYFHFVIILIKKNINHKMSAVACPLSTKHTNYTLNLVKHTCDFLFTILTVCQNLNFLYYIYLNSKLVLSYTIHI